MFVLTSNYGMNRWGCQPSKFPWSFDATETMYLLEGKVVVFVDGYEGSFEIGAGDLVIFPKGMNITWDVLKAVNKHYSLEK
uniref:(S)-ureidoglycine aminohydrolase cupin domain-containing protein n=1 Tax=Rhizophora mucronata TaxID=61149 RepID=A0A2P2JX27_RHIMU